jgi:hypothetical protein
MNIELVSFSYNFSTTKFRLADYEIVSGDKWLFQEIDMFLQHEYKTEYMGEEMVLDDSVTCREANRRIVEFVIRVQRMKKLEKI